MVNDCELNKILILFLQLSGRVKIMIIMKDIIELYRLGLIIGYFSIDDIIDCADNLIEIEEESDNEIIEISLSKKKGVSHIIEKLNQMEYNLKSDLAPKILLGLIYKDFSRNKESVDYLKSFAKMLYKLSLHISNKSIGKDIKYEINIVEDYLESALYYDVNFSLASFVNKAEDLLETFLGYAIDYENSKYSIRKAITNNEILGYWYSFEDGKSLGTRGSEKGVITRDEEYSQGARITLEKGKTAPYSITYGVYGLMCDTKFYGDIETAEKKFEIIKYKIAKLIDKYPDEHDDSYDKKMDIIYKLMEELVNLN